MAENLIQPDLPSDLDSAEPSPYPRQVLQAKRHSTLTIRLAHGFVACIYAAATIAVVILAASAFIHIVPFPNFDAYAPLGAFLLAVAFFAGFFDRKLKPRASVLATICGFILGFLVIATCVNTAAQSEVELILYPLIGGFVIGALSGFAGLLTQTAEIKSAEEEGFVGIRDPNDNRERPRHLA